MGWAGIRKRGTEGLSNGPGTRLLGNGLGSGHSEGEVGCVVSLEWYPGPRWYGPGVVRDPLGSGYMPRV